MGSERKSVRILEDVKMNVKIKLSATGTFRGCDSRKSSKFSNNPRMVVGRHNNDGDPESYDFFIRGVEA